MAQYTYQASSMPVQTKKGTSYNSCPSCGALQCLCRPRFFAGQLLTEEDLNRLDRYIIEKNKLHNRHLHGWGVVCGLEVLCHPCEGQVTVKKGYGISPCGEDIVVCNDAYIDVCKMIRECREQEKGNINCQPPLPGGDEVEEKWVLAIRYQEQSTRGITALPSISTKNSSKCGCGNSSRGSNCNCGCGSSSNGCGCNNNKNSSYATSSQSSAQSTLAQCEPTIVCEGFCFDVYPAPDTVDREEDPGALIRRISDCLETFTELLGDVPGIGDPGLELWCAQTKPVLNRFFAQNPINDCTVFDDIAAINCADPESIQQGYSLIFMKYIFHCICSGLLPPCPEKTDDPRIPLATITVSGEACKIMRVCNWTTLRKFATTFPNLQYWLSPFSFVRALRVSLESICCQTSARDEEDVIGVRGSQASRQAASRTTSANFSSLLFESFTGQASRPSAASIFKGAMGQKDEDGQPYLKDLERENLPQFILTQLLQPSLSAFMAGDTLKTFGAFQAAMAASGNTGAEKAEIEDLKARLAEQEKKIDELLKKKPGK